jgi:hypothetical protein
MFRCFLAGWAGILLTLTVSAEDLRVDNNVQGVKSTAFLLAGKFYSIIGDNGEIVEFDAAKKTFTLIDPALRIQTQIDAEETRKKVEQLRQQILNDPNTKPDSFRYFAFKPVFVAEFDSASGLLALQSNWIDYDIKTIPLTDGSAGLYYDFCDWICYLNFRLNPRSGQMLIRLEVNRLLREQQRFATNVSESIYANGKQGLAKADHASSTHAMSRRLSDADRKQIEQVQEFKRTFPQVSFDEYQKSFAEKLTK